MVGTPPSSNALVIKDGDFYVEPGCCLLCGVPEDLAPEVFQTGEDHCFVRRQPCSRDEVDRTIRAMWSSEVDCVRYRGHDPGLLDRLARAGMSGQADHPRRLGAQAALRDKVTFSMTSESGLSPTALGVASALRTDMRASGRRVLPALFGRRSIWVSWFGNQFHQVRVIEECNGKLVAHLQSRTALPGLAWLVHDWLRAKGAEGVLWQTDGDPDSLSPMPM
jgi:hypothetical protein